MNESPDGFLVQTAEFSVFRQGDNKKRIIRQQFSTAFRKIPYRKEGDAAEKRRKK